MGFVGDAQSWARKQGAPVSIGILAAMIVSFLLAWFTHGAPLRYLALTPQAFLPWTPLTYPFADTGNGTALIWFLMLLLWFYWVGTSLEREIGSTKFGMLFLAMTLLPALFVGLGGVMLGNPIPLVGANLPIAGLTVAWGIRNATSIVRLWMIIPVTGLFIAILTVAVVLFGYGTVSIPLGVLACVHLGAAYLFATNRIPGFTYSKPVYQYKPTKEKVQQDNRYFEEVRKREQERQERERLRKLFEKSGLDE